MRATELLKEEYPLSEEFISHLNDEQSLFETEVAGFEGVGRFVLGLVGEIEIVYPDDLKEFIKNRIKNSFADLC